MVCFASLLGREKKNVEAHVVRSAVSTIIKKIYSRMRYCNESSEPVHRTIGRKKHKSSMSKKKQY